MGKHLWELVWVQPPTRECCRRMLVAAHDERQAVEVGLRGAWRPDGPNPTPDQLRVTRDRPTRDAFADDVLWVQ